MNWITQLSDKLIDVAVKAAGLRSAPQSAAKTVLVDFDRKPICPPTVRDIPRACVPECRLSREFVDAARALAVAYRRM